MYIEIGPRQTGKTTRMLHHVREVLEDNKELVVNIVTLSSGHKEYMKHILEKSGTDMDRVKFSTRMVRGSGKVKYFVDLFDYMDPMNLFIDEDAYYVTDLAKEKGSQFTRALLAYKYKFKEQGSEIDKEEPKKVEPLQKQLEYIKKQLNEIKSLIMELKEKPEPFGTYSISISNEPKCTGECDFTTPWFGIAPPSCKKCGSSGMNINTTY